MKSIKIVAASIAALTLAGCANDEYIGNGESPQQSKNTEISFAMKTPNMTRAGEEIIGSAAATKLNKHFVVYGTKHTTAEDGTATNDQIVFNQYQVEWADNTAGTTESNTHNWEYVGKNAYASITGTQSIKYWDYSAANGYTFYAFSSKDITYPAASGDKVVVTKVTADPATSGQTVYKKGYQVEIKDGASLGDIYYSDRTPVAKSAYGQPVVLTFRNMSSKVRVGFYETIPGYSVKIDNFYYDNDATAVVTTYKAMDQTDASNFQAALQNVGAPSSTVSNKLTVTYYDNTDPKVENRPTVTNTTVNYQYNLKLGTGIQTATKIGEASNAPTWDNEGNYTSVYPFEANNNPMLIRCDYTLKSTDGSGEEIKVKNARVVVPAQYVQWKSNYAYTYLFKISDKTNGTTGSMPTDPDDPTKPTPTDPDDPDSPTITPDPEGLFPITFDAVVVSTVDGNQETITTVASNSVTSYQNGVVVTANNEYKAGDIYVVNSNITAASHPVIVPAAIGDAATNAQIYKVTSTGDAISEATVLAKLNGAPNGLNLAAADPAATLVQKVPAEDGTNYDFGSNGAVKFAASTGTTYAYVYCTTKYVATEYEAAGDTFDPAKTYFFKTDKNVYYAASGLSADNYATYKASLFVVKTAGKAGVYDVKVIKVQ